MVESDESADAPSFRSRSSLRLSKILFDSLVRSSLTWDIDGTRSQTTLSDTRIGTDNKAPGTPQSHVQKINETKMTTGFRVKRRPSLRDNGRATTDAVADAALARSIRLLCAYV